MFYTLLKIQKFFEALYQSFISILRVVFRLHFSAGFRNFKSPVNEIFVLANGPSLRQDLDKYGSKLALCKTMGVNLFVLSEDFILVKPKYYVLLDIVFFMKKTLPRAKDARERMLEAFNKNLSWEMVLFVPAEARNSYFHLQLLALGLPLKFVFFNRTAVEGLRPVRHCMYSRGWGMPPPQNVLIGALMVAIHIGFKKIFILGADHSWHEEIHINKDSSLEITDRHFYDQIGKRLPKHHGETLKRLNMHDFFNELARTFRSHQLVAEFADSKNIEILNASSVSYIDAFKKISLEDLPWDQFLDK